MKQNGDGGAAYDSVASQLGFEARFLASMRKM